LEDQLRAEFVDELRVEGINFMGYGLIPKFVMLHKDLSIESKGIYAYFASYSGSGRSAFPSRDKIISDLCITKDCYYKHFAPLKEMGLIRVEANHSHGGYGNGFANNIYTLVNKPKCLEQNDVLVNIGLVKEEGILGQGFGKIAKAIMVDKRLSLKEKALLAYYCSFAGAGESACPKRDTVLYHLNISESSYKKYSKTLTELNYISIVQRRDKGNFGINDVYLNANPGSEEQPWVKIQDTQIDKKGSPRVKLSDTQKPDAQKSDKQIQDAITNKKTINKKNIISPINPVDAAPQLEEEWDEEKLSFEILKEGNIPSSYLGNPKKLEAAVKLICNYKKYSDKTLYEEFKKGDFLYSSYMLFVDALISMLSNPNSRKIDERTITNETIREKLGRYIGKSYDGSFSLDSLVVEARDLYEDASKVTSPKRPLNFMQRMIWNAMVNGTIITDSMIIHDFDEETGEMF